MIANPDKFQATVVKRNNTMKDSYSLNINQHVINSENCVKLLGVDIDKRLSIEKHISALVFLLKKKYFYSLWIVYIHIFNDVYNQRIKL